jgi:thioredoxin 1
MTFLTIVVGTVLGLLVALQAVVRLRARTLRGKPLPGLPGSWTAKLAGQGVRLLYFFSPRCAACRPLTPRFAELRERRPTSVFLVDVAEDLALARALKVMATPSVVEIEDGRVVNYHVGSPPTELFARYA